MPAFGQTPGFQTQGGRKPGGVRRRWVVAAAALAAGLAAFTVGSWRKGELACRSHDLRASVVDPARISTNLAVPFLSRDVLAERDIETVSLGDLPLPTGCTVAADPLVQPERPAFGRIVPAGAYPLTLYRVQARNALAELRFQSGGVERWELALVPGEDGSLLKDDEFLGYGVDAGIGSFMDIAARAAMLAREGREKGKRGYSNYYDDVIHAEMQASGGEHLMHKPQPDDSAMVAMFRSGWGDGMYPSFWGLDAEGRPVLLVTDFQVLENGDGRDKVMMAQAAILAALTPDQRRDSAEGYAALKADDVPRLEALLAARRITPETLVEEVGGTFTFEAIRLDKPAALEALIRHGAAREVPDLLPLDVKTYPDLARSYAEPRLPEGSPTTLRPDPRSPALMAIVRRWEAGDISPLRHAP